MPLRFSIRDLFWLTLVAALVAAWWVDRSKFAARHEADAHKIATLEKTIRTASVQAQLFGPATLPLSSGNLPNPTIGSESVERAMLSDPAEIRQKLREKFNDRPDLPVPDVFP